jgi:hypothetical protein
MIAGFRPDLLQARPGLQREGKKLRAVIVTGFRLVASPGQKTKSAAAQGATADHGKNRRSSLVAAHQQGQATFLQSQHARERFAGYQGPACDS